jgi:hypothetical protein
MAIVMVMATASLLVQAGGGDDCSGNDSDDDRKKGLTDMVKLDYQKRVVLAKNIAAKFVHLNK